MKQYSIYSFLLFLLFSLHSCNKDNEKPSTNNRGIEFFECKINGEPFEATSNFGCTGPRFDYYPEAYMSVPEEYCLISGVNCQTFKAVSIRIDGLHPQTGNLSFVEPSFADSIYPIYRIPDALSEEILKYEYLIDGSMTIGQFIPREAGNKPLGTIEGTFEFSVTNESEIDTIHITEGRFRFNVPQIF